MDQLPDDILLEITKRLPWKDLVMLGTTSKPMHALALRTVSSDMCMMTVADISTYAVHCLLRNTQVFHRIDGAVYTGYIYERLPDLRMDLGFCQYTSAIKNSPCEWSNHINKDVNIHGNTAHITVIIKLRVDPKEWRFGFSICLPEYINLNMEPEAIQRVLYIITTPEERRIMSLALLASWYAHARSTLHGRRLRSHARKAWLPDELPKLYDYVKTAHDSMDAFVVGK